MLSAALLLLANSLFLTLRLTGDTGSFPKPLSAGEERMYLERSLAGDLEARNILVEHNLRLVAHIIKKYYTQAAEQEDLISIGTIGLIKAVDTFRPERKIRLATYASRCVENEVLMYFRSRKKLQGEVSLSDTIEPDAAGGALSLMDVVGCDDTMLSDMADLEERMLTPDGEKTVPFEDQLGVMPGSDVSKIVTVTNTGGQPAWVRVSLDKAIELARGVEGEADLSLVTCDLNTESWTEKDGYYYYNAALEPGQTTEPLFTAVHFAETMSNMYQESRAILQVNAFATQTAHNGASALEAAGWPEA